MHPDSRPTCSLLRDQLLHLVQSPDALGVNVFHSLSTVLSDTSIHGIAEALSFKTIVLCLAAINIKQCSEAFDIILFNG